MSEIVTSASSSRESSTDKFYENNAEEYARRTLGADMSSLQSRFLNLLPPGSRILDAGCGSGRDLRTFVERGYRPVGIDASGALIDIARQYSHAPCFEMRIEDMVFDEEFDGVWACASLLHFQKGSLGGALFRIHRALVRDGLFFATVQEGNGERTGADGRYFAYYQLTEFTNFVSTARFVIEDAWSSKDVLGRGSAQPTWLNVMARKG